MLAGLVAIMLMMEHTSHTTEICSSSFPNRETTLLLENIVQQYAHEQTFVDYSTRMHATRKVITEATLLRINTRQLYLESKSVVGECTFRFETKRFSRVPVYVQVSPNEEAHPFNRLHFMCPPHTTCCGLFCCPQETQIIQQEFVALSSPATDSSDFRRIDDDSQIDFGGSTYSLKQLIETKSNERVCAYQLSDEDTLRRTVRLTSEQPPSAIYFLCPRSSKCCQLKCESNSTNSPKRPLASSARRSTDFTTTSNVDSYKIYAFYSTLFVLMLATISFSFYRIYERRKLLTGKRRSFQRHIGEMNSNDLDPQSSMNKFLKPCENDFVLFLPNL
ncbi:hypothetical protein Tcan_08424 [Toxocara canis]|uniref:CX domain-containing protein n=1 Tax=Toxocara canis TaxID=6265 RepID=A0A0B2VSW7_TOXCA|nr:hypothetical protein Tcan_08424 [Toxocara canis]